MKLDSSFSSVLEIDLGVIVQNFHTLQTQAGSSRVYPVVKANAYGMGMAKIAPVLAKAGAEGFFVAQLQEGIELRALIGDQPIYVFYGLLENQEEAFKHHKLTPVLNTKAQFNRWSATDLDGAFHIDTGLNRLGFAPHDIPDINGYEDRIKLVMSHLACSDDPDHTQNAEQLALFQEKTAHFKCAKSLAASGGLYLGPEYHFDLVRPGIALYGGNPQPSQTTPVKNPVTWKTKLLQVKGLEKGQKVGYGATFEAPTDMTIGILAHGYADGYKRSAFETSECVYGPKICPVLGRISMDLIVIDVTGTEAQEGDFVELIGEDISLDKLADFMCTISYEVITSLHTRAQLIYKEPEQSDFSPRQIRS